VRRLREGRSVLATIPKERQLAGLVFDEVRMDRGREARVVEAQRDVRMLALRSMLPRGADLVLIGLRKQGIGWQLRPARVISIQPNATCWFEPRFILARHQSLEADQQPSIAGPCGVRSRLV